MANKVMPRIMGIINVTPDSFSDGGLFATTDQALEQAGRLVTDGADILDIGGESTRPGAPAVSEQQEIDRVVPVIEALHKQFSTPISIDTTKATVARAALAAGADIINDVSALMLDSAMLSVVQESSAPVIIMHMQGTPQTMQQNPSYQDVVTEVADFLRGRAQWLERQGVARERIIIDPGIGFGKTLEHNLALLANLPRLTALGYPLLLGHSRKRFLGLLTGIDEERDRDLATAVVSALCLQSDVAIFRVHNVAATRQALQVASALHSYP